jgi:hypothetical protein
VYQKAFLHAKIYTFETILGYSIWNSIFGIWQPEVLFICVNPLCFPPGTDRICDIVSSGGIEV